MPFLRDWEGAVGSDLLAENVFMDNRVQDLVARSRELFREAGEIEAVGPVEPMNQLRGTFRLHGADGDLQVFFTPHPRPNPACSR